MFRLSVGITNRPLGVLVLCLQEKKRKLPVRIQTESYGIVALMEQ